MDEPRRQACHVPPEVRYQTRHEQCLEMLDLWGDQVPHGWVTGDDELGRHTQFRGSYDTGASVMCSVCPVTRRYVTWRPRRPRIRAWTSPKAPWQSVSAWRRSLTLEGWTRLTVRDGEKGPVEIEMVKRRVQTRLERKRTGPEEWLVVTGVPLGRQYLGGEILAGCHRARRPVSLLLLPHADLCVKVEIKEPSLSELARVIKAGLCIESSFKRGKGEAGWTNTRYVPGRAGITTWR